MPIPVSIIIFFVGARLVWKKIEDMDPFLTQRLSVETHCFALVATFLWPIALAIAYMASD